MINEQRIRDLTARAMAAEQAESEGEVSGYSATAWSFVFRSLTEDEFTRLESMNDAGLSDFMFSDHSNDPAWEKMNDLMNFHEEWSYNPDFVDRLAKLSDKNMDDPSIWEWCLARMPITRKDYEFLTSLSEEHLESIAMGDGSPSMLGSESLYPAIQAAHPDYDLSALEPRLGAAYSLWEAHVMSHGDDWADHP